MSDEYQDLLRTVAEVFPGKLMPPGGVWATCNGYDVHFTRDRAPKAHLTNGNLSTDPEPHQTIRKGGRTP